jgi:CO/xanthine dehydrogenase Mo-binding subunit/CO/xanthine dehydrogenase FAD-binding subunit
VTIAPDRRTGHLGASVPNLEWHEKTSGVALYADDIRPEGLLHAAILRSPLPHALIRGLDVSAVLASPGVVGVVTAADLPGRNYIHHGHHLADRTVLASEKVRYIGEEIAGVAAETPEQARAALALFRLDLKRLPEVTELEQARRPGAVLVHDGCEDNVALAFAQSFGEVPPAVGETVAVTGSYTFPRQNHVCMETNSVVVSWEREIAQLHVWISSQAPYFVEKELAHVLDLPRESIIVHEVAVGGGFGSKSKIAEYETVAAALSIKTGRPVRLALSRDEEFETTKSRHRFEITMTTAADSSGRLLSRDADVVVENGAFNHSGPSVMGAGTGAMASLYDVPKVSFSANLVYTNKHPGGQFRGYGNPQATFAVESQMDELAEKLGIDPFDFRIRNANLTGQRTHVGYELGSAALVECLEAARDAIGWSEKRDWRGSGRGVGVAAGIQVSGANVYPGADTSSAALAIDEHGRVELRFGGADAGTGQRTMLAQVVADEVGVPLAAVDVTMMDSLRTPTDLGAWSSRGTYMSAHATRATAGRLREELASRAAKAFGLTADLVEVADGMVRLPGESMSVADLMARTASLGPLEVEQDYRADVEEMDWASGTGNISGAYSFAAHAVEVEIDRDTGKLRIVDYVAAHDSGVVLNPLLADSQVIGGVVMGLGAALGEELVYEGGRMVNGSYVSYPVPRAGDVPRIRPLFVQGSDPRAPYGAKGIGEIVLVPTVAAVGNAIKHATGARLTAAPFTPDKVLTGWREAEGRDITRSYHVWRRPSRWQVATIRAAYPRGLHRLLDRVGTRWARPVEPLAVVDILTPSTTAEAVVDLQGEHARPLGGGTDLVPGQRRGKQALGTLVDLTLVPGLARIDVTPDSDARIGGAVRLATLAEHRGSDWQGVLGDTARMIASHQVREMATLAGNLCQEKRCWFYRNDFNCYKRGGATCPCYAVEGDHRFQHAVQDAHRCQAVTPSDLATTLSALAAEIEVAGPRGTRRFPVADLYSGPGETTLAHGELVTDVVVPADSRTWTYAYEKLDLYTGDFAVVSAAVGVRAQGRSVTGARLVLGAVAPTPLRLPAIERQLVGTAPTTMAELRTLAAGWGAKAHPLKRNEWKVEAAAGVLAKAMAAALAIPLD